LSPTEKDLSRWASFFSPPPSIQNLVTSLEHWIDADNAKIREISSSINKAAFATMSLASGGAERQWALLARESARNGWETSMVTFLPQYQGSDHYEHLLGTEIAIQKTADLPQNWTGLAPRIDRDALAVIKMLPPSLRDRTLAAYHLWCNHSPDAVICQQDPANIYGGIAALLAGVPQIVLSIRAMWPTKAVADVYPWLGDLYPILARSRRVRFCANSMEAALDFAPHLGLSSEEISYLPNAMDHETWHPPSIERRQKARADLGIANNEHVVLAIARFVEDKQHNLLLEIMAPLLKKHPNVRLLLVGEGPLKEEVNQQIHNLQISKQAEILPVTKDTGPLYQAADLFVLASRNEGTPNVLLEAGYYGLPVVAFRVGGVASCCYGNNFQLVNPGDRDAFASAVEKVLAENTTRTYKQQNSVPTPAEAFQILEDMLTQNPDLPPKGGAL
jgi:glycosyltransferase involved in cell wall biosynthesis